MRSPIQWFGGKGLMTAKLLPLIPPHRIYVEPFGGGASLIFAKPPSAVEIYNDLDSGLVNLFRVLRDPKKFRRLRRLAELTPCSREEYDNLRRRWDSLPTDVERAWAFFVVARQSFSGIFGHSWSYTFASSRGGMSACAFTYLGSINRLPDIRARLMRVQIEHQDFTRIIAKFDSPETFFYCDPPYPLDTRRDGGYRHELNADQHKELIRRLLRIQGQAMLSGYRSAVHQPLEKAGWKRRDFRVCCYAAGRTRGSGIQGPGSATARQPRTESVWLSPNCWGN